MTRVMFPFMFLLLIIGMVFLVISEHAVDNHALERLNSTDVLNILTNAAYAPQNNICMRLTVASCPLATCQDKASCRFGEVSPQAKVFCELKPGWGAYGVFGLKFAPDIIYVTGYAMETSRFEKMVVRDKCIRADISYLQTLLPPPGITP